ncbi:hypothetical protein PR048_007481 [Dryococelus australis]|uniref:Tc1-like transposase DDE domain-containing protein n=1 Tax=Dryococelus australis TaxID=614101 RepID=A0ABQ9HUG3_9NEOP|nr:hypothetical protein PR048_007481 [Dryococelus australis]
MRVIEVIWSSTRMKRGGTGDPRENSLTNGIVQHDSHMRKSGVTRPRIEPHQAQIAGRWADESAGTLSHLLPFHRRPIVRFPEEKRPDLSLISGTSMPPVVFLCVLSLAPLIANERARYGAVVTNSLDSHSGGPGFDYLSGHPDFGFPWFPEITPGECWDGSLTKAMAASFPNPSSLTSVDLCFTAFGVGPLVFVRGSMNTEAYCNILDNEMLPKLWRFYGMDPCYFQDDNVRCHVSRATMQWYADNNVRRLDWPTQSPDLNPIEHLWDELDRRVRARQARPNSIAQLMEWLQEQWKRIPMDVLQTLLESMPDRVAAVIASRGEVLSRGERSLRQKAIDVISLACATQVRGTSGGWFRLCNTNRVGRKVVQCRGTEIDRTLPARSANPVFSLRSDTGGMRYLATANQHQCGRCRDTPSPVEGPGGQVERDGGVGPGQRTPELSYSRDPQTINTGAYLSPVTTIDTATLEGGNTSACAPFSARPLLANTSSPLPPLSADGAGCGVETGAPREYTAVTPAPFTLTRRSGLAPPPPPAEDRTRLTVVRASEVSMKQCWNGRAGETGNPRENLPTSGIVRHDCHMRKSGVNRSGIEPGWPWWEASSAANRNI